MKKHSKAITLLVFALFLANNLKSQTSVFQTDSITSIYLKELRYMQTYLPPQYDENTIYPIILATDGQIIAEGRYDGLLDSLILNKIIDPIVLIAPYSNEKIIPETELEYRSIEYIYKNNVNDENKAIYSNHFRFFTEEALDFVSTLYGVNTSGMKLFYGCSNGAGFGVDMASRDQLKIDHYICMSPLGSDINNISKLENPPHIYIAYGDEEEAFFRQLEIEVFNQLIQQLQKQNYPTQVHVYEGGHERDLWKKEFATCLSQIFENLNAQ